LKEKKFVKLCNSFCLSVVIAVDGRSVSVLHIQRAASRSAVVRLFPGFSVDYGSCSCRTRVQSSDVLSRIFSTSSSVRHH